MDDIEKLSQSARLEAKCQAWAWRLHTQGKKPDEIAADLCRNFCSGKPLVSAQSVEQWLNAEILLRTEQIEIPLEPQDKTQKAIRLLAAELSISKDLFENVHVSQHAERVGARAALLAVIDFINRFSEMAQADLSAPIYGLHLALVDLERGFVAPVLQPKKKGGHRPLGKSIGNALVEAYAVTAMEAAMEQGMSSPTQAATAVARELQRLGFAIHGKRGSSPAVTVRKWREKASEGGGQSPLSADRFLRTMREAKKRGQPFQPWKQILAAAVRLKVVAGAPVQPRHDNSDKAGG